jgi:hypothetical protein
MSTFLSEKYIQIKENKQKTLIIIPLTVWAITLGRRISYMIQLKSNIMLSFNEKIVGVWIIITGLMIHFNTPHRKVSIIKSYVGEINFLSWISTSNISKIIYHTRLISKNDLTWTETLRAKGLLLVFKKITKKNEINKIIFFKIILLSIVFWVTIFYFAY